MTFNSWEFILFYPIVLLLYFVLPKKAKWPMLLIASYVFYLAYQPELVFLIFGTTVISWVSSIVITKTDKPLLKKISLVLTLAVSLGVLLFYKYFDFLAGTVFDLFVNTGDYVSLGLVLPVGISFYTFQTLSYAIDVYRGDVEVERNFFFYALFVSFFPQLVAGPIERPGNLIPQLKEPHKWSRENALEGAKFMLLGFFKKVCVADLVSGRVEEVFSSPETALAPQIIIAAVLFAVQIYCDFSGYTDIAIGCARIMGIRLMKNFDRPYSATTVKEFWSRWHISLSSWFKDYLYIPLGGNRRGFLRTLLNILIVFTVSGLWHGAAWTFVLWGVLHGVFQVVGRLTLKSRNAFIEKCGLRTDSPAVLAVRRVNTFILVTLLWIFFRANSIGDAFTLFSRIFVGWSAPDGTAPIAVSLADILLTVLAIAVLFILDRLVTYGGECKSSSVVIKNGAFVYLVWSVLLVWALLLSYDMVSTFIYFQF